MPTEEKPCEGIYFLSLTLENVRCFGEKQTLQLFDGEGRPAQWTVILGNNASGKTTLLEILAEGMRILEDFHINFRRTGTNTNKSQIEAIFAIDSSISNQNKKFLLFKCEAAFSDNEHEGNFCGYENDFPYDEGRIPLPWVDNKALPIDTRIPLGNFIISDRMMNRFSYSANRRISRSSSSNNFARKTNSGLNEEDELIDAEEWLLQFDYIANKKSKVQEYYKERLKMVEDVLVSLLPDVEAIRISDPSEKYPNPRVEFKMPDGWLHLSQLSLGYQTMTSWMVDLAARMFAAYPNSPNPIAEPAVVLIDEIDLHLHPKWQRTIMSYLSERFINTQFIVTAHSPLIVQAAEQANIVVLKREGDSVTIHQQKEDVQGWRIDQLLTSDLFDLGSARSPFYENKLAQRRQILSKPELTDEDKEQLKVLEAEIGDLPTAETAEDIAAMDIIRRAAELLKTSA